MPELEPRRGRALCILLKVLNDPRAADTLNLDDWDQLVRVARAARLLASLHYRLAAQDRPITVPALAAAHLVSEVAIADHRTQTLRFELHALSRALAASDAVLVLLKGAAYVAQDLSLARGRIFADVDLMVPHRQLHAVEERLITAGWQTLKIDPYDQHYYRAWAHELPPMKKPGHVLELDLHHTILPLTGRLRPKAPALFEASTPLPGTAFRVLSSADQVLHAAAHLFQDSDCSDRLRDLVDIDNLLRHFGSGSDFWNALESRTVLHGFGRPLWYALRYCSQILNAPIPDPVWIWAGKSAPGQPTQQLMDWLIGRALPPVDPDELPSVQVRFARWLLLIRSFWLRMPPWLLVSHLSVKWLKRRRAPRDENLP
jgi:hypothetical protein